LKLSRLISHVTTKKNSCSRYKFSGFYGVYCLDKSPIEFDTSTFVRCQLTNLHGVKT